MTKINLITQGQQLICTNKVVVASGDINSVELHVEFDSAWDEYPAKSATFYTSKNEAVQEMLLLNNSCIVPFEVLTESCVLFVGVRGVSADGEKVKTSSLVKYKISEGAPVGDKTLTPTMDLYQQYLAALKAEADPVIAEIKAAVQAESAAAIAEVKAEALAMAAELQSTTLWENPDTSAAFAAKTVTFDATEFKTFRILCEDSEHTISRKNHKTTMMLPLAAANMRTRAVTILDTGATFENCENGSNNSLIPYKIIGYKY